MTALQTDNLEMPGAMLKRKILKSCFEANSSEYDREIVRNKKLLQEIDKSIQQAVLGPSGSLPMPYRGIDVYFCSDSYDYPILQDPKSTATPQPQRYLNFKDTSSISANYGSKVYINLPHLVFNRLGEPIIEDLTEAYFGTPYGIREVTHRWFQDISSSLTDADLKEIPDTRIAPLNELTPSVFHITLLSPQEIKKDLEDKVLAKDLREISIKL